MADVATSREGEVTADGTWKDDCDEHDGMASIEARSPGADARGLVAPSITRPVLTASKPCQTMATTGPDAMYLMRPGKKDLPLRSA